jgi:hypothetical protein
LLKQGMTIWLSRNRTARSAINSTTAPSQTCAGSAIAAQQYRHLQ